MSVIVIIPRMDQASHRYHSEGGAVVVAASEDDARTLLNVTPDVTLLDTEWEGRVVYELAKDYPPNVTIFPDAGCC